MRRLLPSLVVALLATGCGGGDAPDERSRTVTGRLMSVSGDRVCVSDDRGESTRCVDTADPGSAGPAPEVGECVELSDDDSIVVVDESACAGGDLGP